jgi:hypothetical protein
MLTQGQHQVSHGGIAQSHELRLVARWQDDAGKREQENVTRKPSCKQQDDYARYARGRFDVFFSSRH